MTELSLAQANRLIDLALQRSSEASYAPMAVVVLDSSGCVKAVQRQDGASMFRVDVATAKAWGAIGIGVSSRTLAERAKDNPNFFVALAATANGRFLAHPGAVLIKDGEGQVIGAVGASGGTGDEDEDICASGVERAGFKT